MPLDKVLGFFADNKEVTQLIAKSVPAIMGFHQANKSKNAIEDYQTKLDNIEKSRQQIVNPYANVTNPFANMQVATKAAEMQAEQADISLANTLDNLRETGAGGATALAQAALRSKQGITANIQQQETQNQRLYAQGQQQMEMAKAQGEQARFNMQENRDVRDTYRLQMQMDLAQQQRAAGLATGAAALASGIGGLSTFINPEARNTETTNSAATNSANQRASSSAQTNLLNLQNQQGIVQQLPTTAPPTVMVPGATTLGQYYQGLGQSLPSPQDRAPLYEQFGLGTAGDYVGDREQNALLLEYLQNQ
jgi:DNA gyrase/topoisomerase IV subunit A